MKLAQLKPENKYVILDRILIMAQTAVDKHFYTSKSQFSSFADDETTVVTEIHLDDTTPERPVELQQQTEPEAPRKKDTLIYLVGFIVVFVVFIVTYLLLFS